MFIFAGRTGVLIACYLIYSLRKTPEEVEAWHIASYFLLNLRHCYLLIWSYDNISELILIGYPHCSEKEVGGSKQYAACCMLFGKTYTFF